MTEEGVTLYRGLREVYIDRTTSSFINGKEGKLYYRGYSIDDLAKNASFEEVSYLIIYGELPNKAELKSFDEKLKFYRSLPNEIFLQVTLHKSAVMLKYGQF